MRNKTPSQYPQRVLLMVSGMSPQILTETLWALTQRKEDPFFPTQVHLLTTVSGERNALLNLLDPAAGQFLKFCKEFDLDSSVFTPQHVHVIRDSQGRLLEDIRTPEENEAAADYITEKVREFTASDELALHVSMAGGRKTMGYYAGYALSLFGREQDRLSHVLVSAPYERLSTFYFPTRERHLIQSGDHGVLDARDAKVTLAEIPFLRLREEVPPPLLAGSAGFSETIQRTQRGSEAERLTLDTRERTLVIAGEQIDLAPVLFAFYAWFLQRLLRDQDMPTGRDLLDENTDFSQEFLDLFEQIEGPSGRDLDRTRDSMCRGMERAWFDEKKSRVNRALEQSLGRTLARRFQITSVGKRGNSRFVVPLEAEQIEWLE